MDTQENWQGINTKGDTIINNPQMNWHLPASHPQLNPLEHIPNRGITHFVGRDQELTTLHEKLQAGEQVAICAVAGMGGVGKTELATQYARRNIDSYPGGICWLTARDGQLTADILQFAQLQLNLNVPQELEGTLLNSQQQVEWCWQHWQPAEGLVLVVLDNVTDLSSCLQILPSSNRFRVLLTTRQRNLDSNFFELSLDVLSPEAALALLTAVVGEERVAQEPQKAAQLCAWLGYLPLGLELVGSYLLEDPDLRLERMLARLKKQRLMDESINRSWQQMGQTASTAQLGVKDALELSWQELDPMAQQVGQFVSLFAAAVFSWQWVESATELLKCAESDINEAKKQLYKRYLIERIERINDREACYKIHPLVREFLQAKLAESGEGQEFKQAFAAGMVEIARNIPDSPTLKDIESVRDAIPHLEEVAEHLTEALKDEDLISHFAGLGRFYQGQGLYSSAEPWCQQCLSVVKMRLGVEHPDVASSLNNLALFYYSQGRYTEAEPLYLEALELCKRLLGVEHPQVATTLNNLASLYESQGRYKEAEPLYLEALELSKRLLGVEHPQVATTLNNLALFYYSQERYTEAEPLYLEALALCERVLGVEHPNTVTFRNNLVILREEMRKSNSWLGRLKQRLRKG
ncbi:tetratricopeptide repeat protein [Lyngbya aestuarii]|uniref:tetratricopeptide repeat protein n=1 Tax=Lyngbya aestuarii TaxID=118322 RepID=UPI00403DB4D1